METHIVLHKHLLLLLQHMARSRAGFAAGALLAARWIIARKGVFEFSEVIDEILKK